MQPRLQGLSLSLHPLRLVLPWEPRKNMAGAVRVESVLCLLSVKHVPRHERSSFLHQLVTRLILLLFLPLASNCDLLEFLLR